jgi:hypothetical protein
MSGVYVCRWWAGLRFCEAAAEAVWVDAVGYECLLLRFLLAGKMEETP